MSQNRGHNNRKGRVRAVAVAPSLVTLLNAVCGFAAIHFVSTAGNDPETRMPNLPLTYFAAAGYMIFLAMIADALDGQLARRSGSTSRFGEVLDSLADMVSFGVAPAFVMLRVVECSLRDVIGPVAPVFGPMAGKLLWLIAAAYVCCAALRLAKFTVETQPETSSHMGFSGLPSPAAAGVIAALVLVVSDLLVGMKQDMSPVWVAAATKTIVAIVYALPVVTLGVSLLMVSQVPYPHMLNRYIRGKRSFGHVVRVVLLVLVLVWNPQLTSAIVFIAFAASPGLRWIRHRLSARSPAEAVESGQQGEQPGGSHEA
ncbi:MAG: CDP-alcohol phosphatidyltransferase family protein [Alphaproteobacteria bacterium]